MLKQLRYAITLLCGVLIAWNVTAQETTSEIGGRVMDGTAGVSGVTVTAIHVPTGTKYVTTTRKDGRYNLPGLRVGGPYTLTTSYVGYKNEKQENIILSLGQEYKGDFTLAVSATDLTEVIVTTSRQNKLFNNNHTGSQEIITRDQIEKLPTINRSLQDFTRLEPTANGLNFGGRSSQYNNVTVDGANFNNSFGLSGTLGGQTNSQPISLEAIDQIQVNISPYDVRQGGFTGGGVNSVTKSGSNTFKGSVYTYLKGPGTQGYNVENSRITKTDFSYYIRGASLGGAIVKNKLFFFASYETVNQTAPASSMVGSSISGGLAPGGNVSTANADTLTALRNFLISNYKYDPGAFQNYSFLTKSDKATVKIDWNIDSKSTLTLKYNYLKSYADQFPSTSRPGTGQATGGSPVSTTGSGNTSALPFYGAGYGINNNFNIYLAELNTRFSKSFSNKLQIGYTALRDFRAPHSSSATFPFVDILNSAGNVMTSFGYEMYTYNNTLNTDVYQFADIATLYKGSHEITFGTQDYYRKYQNAFAPGYQGVYQFNSYQDFINNAPAKNYYLQYSALSEGAFPWAYAGSTELGVFAQDKWRATKNFTLTYGLRFDMTIYKQDFTDNPYFDALPFKNGTTYNIGKAPGNALLISPRVGFNWDVKGDHTLQFRGGLGIFSGPPPFVWISNQASNNGIQFGSFTNTSVTFNQDPTHYRPAAGQPNAAYSTALTSHDFKYPTVLKSSLALDKKFKNDWVLTFEASYSKDINAVYYSNINLNETNAYALSGADNRMRYKTTTSATDYSNAYYHLLGPASAPTNTLTSPNIGNAILMSNTNQGFAYTLTAKIQKTFHNLYVSGAYTFSNAKNAAAGGSTASSLWSGRPVGNADPNAANLGYADYYQPHRVIIAASYKLDYAKHFSTSVGAIFEAAPAGTTSYVYNGDVNGDGNTGNDLIYIPKNVTNGTGEINLVKSGSGGLGTGATTDTRTTGQIWAQLNNFINQDHYLSFHRGQYAQANAVVLPFFKKLDLNVTQDIYFFTKSGKDKDKHTLRLSLDLINAGNLFNRNWGIVKTTNSTNFLKFEGLAADGKTPSYSFTYLDATNQIPLVNSFTNNTGITSRWQMQFGIKYLFN